MLKYFKKSSDFIPLFLRLDIYSKVQKRIAYILYSNNKSLNMVVENRWTDEQIVEWVTILTIFLFASFPREMIELSETSLGKLFFASIIIYYSMIDPIYGIIACAIVIVYYQMDLYNSLIAIHRDTILSENMMVMQDSIIRDAISGNAGMYSDVTGLLETFGSPVVGTDLEAFSLGDSSVYSYTPVSEPKNYFESELLRGSRKKELLDVFRKTNCDAKGQLKYKGSTVRPEMADHVFREIQFPNNSAKCNPCDESCEFSIIEERLGREEGLRPVSSKDEPIDWNQFFGHYLVKPITSMTDDLFAFEKQVTQFVFPENK